MMIDRKSTPKHIAMWSCPRSRSTLIARSFGQLDGCIVYDEPFYAPYLVENGFDHPEREAVLACRETDYHQVVLQLIEDLPSGASFSFQKHIAKHLQLDDSQDWLESLDHFFLIRNPKEIILSYYKICQNFTDRDIGIESLFNVFKKVEALTRKQPLVVDANDLVGNPRYFLMKICLYLGVSFSDTMLGWEPGMPTRLAASNNPFSWLWTGELPMTHWYSTLHRSTGFMPFQSDQDRHFPEALMPVLESCLPFYNELFQYRLR
jgi:Sulfotransferase domain